MLKLKRPLASGDIGFSRSLVRSSGSLKVKIQRDARDSKTFTTFNFRNDFSCHLMPRPEADSLNKKVWAQTELWGKSVPDLKIAFFKKSLVLAGTKLSMGLA